MGRWRKQETVTATPAHEAAERPSHPIEPATDAVTVDDGLAAREERLRAAAIHIEGPWAEESRDHAIQLRMRTSEPQSVKTDLDALGELARYLQGWAISHGYLDPIEALRGPEIARWVAGEKRSGGSHSSLKTRRGRLAEVGRLLHPADFQRGRSESSVSQADRLAPVSEADMVMIRHYAALAPEELRERFEVILAVVPWTGARPAELRRLCGTDIRAEKSNGGDIAVVTLTNPAGRTRQVPVVDAAAAVRLLELAAARGGMPVIRAGERNALNRCREYLLRRGVTVDFTVDRLRSAWLVRLSHMRLPLAHALYLADTWDSRVFRQLQAHLPAYEIDTSIELLLDTDRPHAPRALGGAA